MTKNYGKSGNFEFAYDDENNVLHLKDKDNHDGMSLINSITTDLAKTVVHIVQRDIGKKIDFNNMRCFIYTDGSDGFANEVDEYVFAEEGTVKNPFHPLKKEDIELLHWYKK